MHYQNTGGNNCIPETFVSSRKLLLASPFQIVFSTWLIRSEWRVCLVVWVGGALSAETAPFWGMITSSYPPGHVSPTFLARWEFATPNYVIPVPATQRAQVNFLIGEMRSTFRIGVLNQHLTDFYSQQALDLLHHSLPYLWIHGFDFSGSSWS